MQLGADEEGQFQRTHNIQLNDRACFSAMVQEDTLSPPTDVRVQMYRVQNHVIHTLPSTISRIKVNMATIVWPLFNIFFLS